MPKILHVSESNEWSGGAAQLLALAQGLAARGWDIVIGCRPGSGLLEHARQRGLETFTVALKEDYDLVSAYRLARFARARGIDVIHAHHNRSHAVCLLAKALLAATGRAPALVVSRRVSFAPGRNPFSRWKYRSRLIDRIVAVADAVKTVLVEAGVPARRVAVIRSGTDTARFSPRRGDAALKRSLGLPLDRPIVAKIANASPWKGQTIMLEAAKKLVDGGSPAHFLLAGRDTTADWVREKIAALGLQERVTLLGFRSDIPEVLSCVDVSVNAAVQGEGLSGALRESLTMGVPVVASDVAGNRELLAGGSGGWLFAKGDAAALAERLGWVLAHPDEAKAAVRAWQELASGFTLEAMVERTDALYRELLA
jgi:glycosyltransferase involved in cell wall biosynthesis